MSIKAFLPLAVSLTLSPMLPLAVAVVNPCSSVAIAARTYGTDGSDGSSGRSGANGANGLDRTIEATEQPMRVDSNGSGGKDGTSGTPGQRGRCRNHNRPDSDVQAASGGDGGDGGSGGSGGDGGDVTVYYTNLAHLQNLSINAAGGQGGRGGQGKDGGQGCNCHEYSWSETTCTDGNCETENFSCKDGKDGEDGGQGRQGTTGKKGQARIVDRNLLEGAQLEDDNPTVEAAIAQLAAAPINLSRNLWQSRTGAQSLFNGGSVVDDTYEAYVGRVERQFQAVWEADYPEDLASGALNVSIDEAGEIQMTTPEDLWIEGDRTEADGLTTYRIQYALLASEAADLAVGKSDGSGEQFSLDVVDLAGKSDVVETRFYVKYKTKTDDRRARYITQYEDDLPADLLSRSYNKFTLDIGQLPINERYLRPGTQARLEVTIMRTLANNTAEQTLTWNGEL